MDAGEIFGTALLAVAALGSAIVIGVGLSSAIRKYASKAWTKRKAL